MYRFRKLSLLATLAAAAIASIAPAQLNADSIKWGDPVAGLRVGVAIDPGTDQTGKFLRILFKNLASSQQSLWIGTEGGWGPPVRSYEFDIWALSGTSDKERYRVGYLIDGGPGRLVPIGLTAPTSSRFLQGKCMKSPSL